MQWNDEVNAGFSEATPWLSVINNYETINVEKNLADENSIYYHYKKLIQLRKKEGLSQEELGYKLNVTRQTISKWELGQTTPEMDKLVEISKIFNITTDELLSDSDSETTATTNPIIEETVKDNDSRKKIIIIVAIILGIVLLGALPFLFIKNVFNNFFGIFGSQKGTSDMIFNTAQDVIETVQNQMNNQMNNDAFDINPSDIAQKFEEGMSTFEVNSFNSKFELHQGTESGTFLRNLFDKIITNNKKEDKKITLKFSEQETADAETIKKLKSNIDDVKKYEVSFEYNDAGYIYEVSVEELE